MNYPVGGVTPTNELASQEDLSTRHPFEVEWEYIGLDFKSLRPIEYYLQREAELLDSEVVWSAYMTWLNSQVVAHSFNDQL